MSKGFATEDLRSFAMSLVSVVAILLVVVAVIMYLFWLTVKAILNK